MEHRDARGVQAMSELAERLRVPLRELGLSLTDEQAGQLTSYLTLLVPWNTRVNLTGARTADEILDRHLADAFALAAHVPESARRLIDVGAGAGFLGVASAILRPQLRCTLLEPNGKKHTFLRAVAREVPLPRLDPRRERLEEHLGRADFLPYDVAASLATWAPAEWLERAPGLLAPGGLAVAFERPTGGPFLPPDVERVAYRVGPRRGTLLLRRA